MQSANETKRADSPSQGMEPMNPSTSKVFRSIDKGPPMVPGDFALWQRDTLGHLHLECQTRWEVYAANADWDFMTRMHNLRERFFPSGSGRRFYFDKLRDNLVHLYDKMLIHREKKRTSRRTLERGYPAWIREVEPKLFPALPANQQKLQGTIHWVIAPAENATRAILSSLESLDQQACQNWTAWVIAETGRTVDLGVHERDARIKVIRFDQGTDWRAAAWREFGGKSEQGAAYFGLLQPGDRLSPRATDQLLEAANSQPGIGCLYADEDELDTHRALRRNPWFKPDFDPESLLETRALGMGCVFHVDAIAKCGGWKTAPDGADSEQDLIWHTFKQGQSVEHIHLVLFHRNGPVRHGETQAMMASAKKALLALGRSATVSAGAHPGTCEVRPIQPRKPRVSVLIPNRDQPELLKSCIDSILAADYPDLEILIVENASKERATHELYQHLTSSHRATVMPWKETFNYSAVNNFAARQAKGELLLLMNNDVTGGNKDWIARLVEQTLEPRMGAVGPMLLYPDGRIQHAGCVLGVEGTNGHRLRFGNPAERGYGDLLAVTREMTAVTGACLMISKEAYFEVGGMDEFLALTFNDIDLCLKLNRAGRRNILLPRVSLTHHECVTRGHDITPQKRARLACEQEYFCRKWGAMAELDRFHSPYLTSMHNILWLKPAGNLEIVHAAA